MNEDLKYIKTETEEVKRKITQICKKLDDMENVSEIAINYDEVRLKAKVKPISNVLVQSLDEYTKELYYIMLAYSLKDCKNDVVEKLTMLQRLAMGAKLNMTLEDLEKKSYTVNSATVDELIKSANSNHFGEYFLIDLLLVNAVCGKIEKKALDYIAYIAAFLGIGKNTVQAISMFAKNVIERNQKGCISSLKCADIDLNMLKDYLPKMIDGYILKDIYENNSKKIEKVYIINEVFKSCDIDFDGIYDGDITFVNCTFNNSNLTCYESNRTTGNKNIKFEDCKFTNKILNDKNINWISLNLKGILKFKNCEFNNVEGKVNNIVSLGGKKVILEHCIFKNIHGSRKMDSGFVICCNNAEIYDVQFKQISIDVFDRYGHATIMIVRNSVMKNLLFENCDVYCKSDYGRFARIQTSCLKLEENSVISDSEFKKCVCRSVHEYDGKNDNYIVYSVKSTVKNLSFESCMKDVHPQGYSYGYDNYGNIKEEN